MARSRVEVSALIYIFLFSQTIYGAEMEMKVIPGDNITLYCDCPLTRGISIVWIRNCSHEHQPSLMIDYKKLNKETFSRFSLLKNSNNNSFDLHITNITASDLGLYYCAAFETKVNEDKSGVFSSVVYYYGNQTTRLSLAVSSGRFTNVSPPPVSDCFLCWTLLVSVCPVCVILCFICVYCLCHKKTTDGGTDNKEKSTNKFEVDDDGVCYASLDMTTRRPKRLKKKQPESSDLSTYAPIRIGTVKKF